MYTAIALLVVFAVGVALGELSNDSRRARRIREQRADWFSKARARDRKRRAAWADRVEHARQDGAE